MLSIRTNIDYDALVQRLSQIVEGRGERMPEFKSRMDVISHIKRRWKHTFEDAVETGCLLLLNGFSARDFPRRKPLGDEDTQFLQLSYHTARRLMMIAESERINNPADRGFLPDSSYSLYLLSWMPKTMYEKGKWALRRVLTYMGLAPRTYTLACRVAFEHRIQFHSYQMN